MKIIIPMAGHSKRFHAQGYKVPKAFIEIDGRPMIHWVCDMFSPEDEFIFVVKNDVLENELYCSILNQAARRTIIIGIAEHNLGPVHTALAADEVIEDDEPVIFTYCDFYQHWNYSQFLRDVEGVDGGIAAFRGFQPASFGDTYYAYMRVDQEGFVREIREKQPFTDNRIEEYASSGVYYLKSWSDYKFRAAQLFDNDLKVGNEFYLSLIYQPMIEDNQSVRIFEIERFICWGTPEDLEQYLFWSDFFQKKDGEEIKIDGLCSLVPLAGRGSRFKKSGYRLQKPFIPVSGKPMFVNAVKSHPNADSYLFICLDEFLRKYPFENEAKRYFPESEIISLTDTTDGQARTCLMAADRLNSNAPLMISSIDYEIVYSKAQFLEVCQQENVDVIIFTFKTGSIVKQDPKQFAYCRIENGCVAEVVEKQTISDTPEQDHAVVGSFYYRRAADFISSTKTMIEKDIRVNGEFYVGTSINQLIQQGKIVKVFLVDKFISYGNPFELQTFQYWEEHFYVEDHHPYKGW